MILFSDIQKIKGVQSVVSNFRRKGFNYICTDSRKANKDDLFVALKGENHDAHDYLKQVFDLGAAVALVNKDWLEKNLTKFPKRNFIAVNDTTLALGELANIHKKRHKIKTICVGGSNGKTTTKELIAAVLSKKFNVLKTEGNFNNHIGVPLTLLRITEKHTFGVIEIGCNHFDEISYLCKIVEPDYGIITNIGKEHLEFFKNKAGVAKAEFELLDYLENTKKKTVFFANLEDEYVRKRSASYTKSRLVTYSYGYPANVTGKFEGYNELFNPKISFVSGKKSYHSSVQTFGKHSIYNGLAAATVGLKLGVKPIDIISALENFVSSSSKRMEIKDVKGVKVINDTYNSNPDSVKLGLETIKEYNTSYNKHVVLGDMLELGKVSAKEHEAIGKLIAKNKLQFVYTFGPDSKNTTRAAGKLKVNKHFATHEELINELRKHVEPGDIVYVKGSRGMKMEKIVEALAQ